MPTALNIVALLAEAEAISGATNEQLSSCRPTDMVLDEFWSLLNQ
jgi:hypothetical protein